MSNLGFISSKKNLTLEKIFSDVNEIISRRFNGVVEAKINTEHNFIHVDVIGSKSYGYDLHLTSKRKISYKHRQFYYLETVIAHELAAKYNGKLSDEGCNATWDPDVNEYPSLKKYIEKRFSHLENNPNINITIFCQESQRL